MRQAGRERLFTQSLDNLNNFLKDYKIPPLYPFDFNSNDINNIDSILDTIRSRKSIDLIETYNIDKEKLKYLLDRVNKFK